MKDNEKEVNEAEEEVQTEEEGKELTDEQLSQVSGGVSSPGIPADSFQWR